MTEDCNKGMMGCDGPALSNARLTGPPSIMDHSKSTRYVAASYESWLLQCADTATSRFLSAA